MKDGKRKNSRITFNINKSEKFITNGIRFCNEIKGILLENEIATTPVGVHSQKIKADGTKINMLRFKVITKDNNNFINKIGWMK